MKILVIGSCRVKNPARIYRESRDRNCEIYIVPPHFHTIEQINQALKILLKKHKKHPDVADKRQGKLTCAHLCWRGADQRDPKNITEIDKFIIEISGVRNYKCEHGYYLCPFPEFYIKHKKYKVSYSKNYLKGLKEMHTLIGKKPLLIVSNHNIYDKSSRTKMIRACDEFSHNNINVDFFNPTNLINFKNTKKYLYNENHYTPIMHLKMALEIFPRIKRG